LIRKINKKNEPSDQSVAVFLATGFGAGYLPKAPGTWGSLWGILVALLINNMPMAVSIFMMWLLAFVAVWSSNLAIGHFNQQDPSQVVIDEVAGMALTLLWIPMNVFSAVIGFFLFRALDILKPFPVRQIERHFKGGTGIVMDDLAAGLMANMVLRCLGTLNVW